MKPHCEMTTLAHSAATSPKAGGPVGPEGRRGQGRLDQPLDFMRPISSRRSPSSSRPTPDEAAAGAAGGSVFRMRRDVTVCLSPSTRRRDGKAEVRVVRVDLYDRRPLSSGRGADVVPEDVALPD